MLTLLPVEIVHACAQHLDIRDVARLGACTRWLRAAMLDVLCRRGLVVWDRHARTIFTHECWAEVRRLTVRGVSRRLFHGPYVTVPLPSMPLARLDTLVLTHCRLPVGQPFWPAMFDACPVLADVRVTTDFFASEYASDVRHHMDLMTLGVPRLKRLDVDGEWMVVYPVNAVAAGQQDIYDAVMAVQALRPVKSSTLERVRMACRQAPITIDSTALQSAVVHEPHEKPLVVSRMGAGSRESCHHLDWRASWEVFDAAALAPFRSLTHLTIRLEAGRAVRVSRCLATMTNLPPTITHFRLVVDSWLMNYDDSRVEWGEPLAHLTRLRELDVEMKFPPSTVAVLLGRWMGAGASVRRARASFLETIDREFQNTIEWLIEDHGEHADDAVDEVRQAWKDASRPLGAGPLLAWLNHRPECMVHIHNGPYFALPNEPRAPLADITNVPRAPPPSHPDSSGSFGTSFHDHHPRLVVTRSRY